MNSINLLSNRVVFKILISHSSVRVSGTNEQGNDFICLRKPIDSLPTTDLTKSNIGFLSLYL